MKTTITSHRQQQGVALIMFLLMLPVLLGFMTLGIEGGRYLRLKAQMADAAEVASLALSARDTNDDDFKDSASTTGYIDGYIPNEKLAKQYIKALYPDADIESVKVVRFECKDNKGQCNVEGRFTEYQVSVKLKQKSLLPGFGGKDLGFEEGVILNSKAVSRKFQGTGAVDVFLVADFSGSMNWSWDCRSGCEDVANSRLKLLKTVVDDLVSKLESQITGSGNTNTMALIPFNRMTYRKLNENTMCEVQQVDTSDIPNIKADDKTLFEKKDCLQEPKNIEGTYFYTVPSQSDLSVITSELSNMKAFTGTASYEGIIKAGQLALNDNLINSKRLIIVLSDGRDSYTNIRYDQIHVKLLEDNYCDKIRDKIDAQTVDGSDVKSQIAAIGFGKGYDKIDGSLSKCAGEGNVFMADDELHLKELILNLIAEEIGHLYNSDYDSKPEESG